MTRDPDAPIPAPITTPLNWVDDDATRERKRLEYRAVIGRVLKEHSELRGVALALRIGEASAVAPTKRDKELWLEEVNRAEKILGLVR
jgi:hypothetical protein